MARGNKFGWHSGSLTVKDLTVLDDLTFSGGVEYGNFIAGSFIVQGRISTKTEAGASLNIDASSYSYSEGMEMRYAVVDWADVYTLTSFKGLYLRAENAEANASGNIYGMEVYGVANNVNTQGIWGILSYAYIKGATAKTITTAYALQAELSWDAGAANTTISTEAVAGLFKITGGAAVDYTKIFGVVIRAGDMDGASRTYASAIVIEDDAAMAGAITWTNGLVITSLCTNGIQLAGNMTNGLLIANGTYTDAIELGAATNAINISGAQTNVLLVGAAATAVVRVTAAGTNLLSFDAVEGCLSTQATALAGLSATHKLACNIDGVGTVYIPILSAFA